MLVPLSEALQLPVQQDAEKVRQHTKIVTRET
jgi:hypothetical protein